jgi:hypothetical protein
MSSLGWGCKDMEWWPTQITIPLLVAMLLLGGMSTAFPAIGEDSHWAPTHGLWEEVQLLIPPEEFDHRLNFGAKIAIDGDTLIIGTQTDRYHDRWLHCDDGCDWIYVYNRDERGKWMFTQKVKPAEPEAGDTFGFSLAVDEESGVIVAGNPGKRIQENSDHPGLHRKVDQIHIFERSEEGVWEESAIFHRPSPRAQSFGSNVDVSGGTVIAGYRGNLYTFEKQGGRWVETNVLRGHSIATIQGDTIVAAVSHYGDSDCSNERSTYRVYEKQDGIWKETAILEPQNETGDRLYTGAGRLDLSEDEKTLVMGLPMDRRVLGAHTQVCLSPIGDYNPGPMGPVGSGWIYEKIYGEWVMTADIPNPNPSPGLTMGGSMFGISVGISHDRAVFGAKGDVYTGGGPNSGAVYVYEKILGQWVLESKLQKKDPEPQDWFGDSVGISNNVIVAGAGRSVRTGTVHLFEEIDDLPRWEEKEDEVG